jgi:hypothetical protein
MEKTMQNRDESGSAPETFSLLAIILAMTMFGAGIPYEGALLQEPQRTTQLVLPDLNP